MKFLPIFLDIHDKSCLVVGGGDVAARKAKLLVNAGANVVAIATAFSSKFKSAIAGCSITTIEKPFAEADAKNRVLIIAATDDEALNRRISDFAHEQNIPVNVVDNPELCSFIMPSMIDRTPIQIAISTGGSSPVLARNLREKLESTIPGSYGQLGKFAEAHRQTIKELLPDVDSRRRFWEWVLEGEIGELVLAGKQKQADNKMQQALKDVSIADSNIGEVYLVGAGPGDPDLLTFRALRLMQKADVIVHDRLVTDEVMALCRRDAEKIYVGKERCNHAVPQEDINHLLVRLAKEGKRVCRLKGGDPFIFGRGGEEIDTLAEEGINFQVVPAVTAAAGVASYTGIPLTHRDYSQSVVFTTGHLKDGTTDINWNALVHPRQTVVFYMGLHGIDLICKEMIAHGMSVTTPIAMVQQGTTRNQKVVIGTLEDMPGKVHKAKLQAPTLIIVGEVVKLHEKLSWFTPS